MAQLALRLRNLSLAQSFTRNNRGSRPQRIARQVNQRGNRESNKVTGDDVSPHPGNKHLSEQFPAVKQHRFDTRRNTDPHDFPDNGEIERAEIAFQRDAQRGIKAHHQHHDNRDSTDVTGDRQP
ncbi:hypothetical protein D3C87_1490350 [compost metagenome]